MSDDALPPFPPLPEQRGFLPDHYEVIITFGFRNDVDDATEYNLVPLEPYLPSIKVAINQMYDLHREGRLQTIVQMVTTAALRNYTERSDLTAAPYKLSQAAVFYLKIADYERLLTENPQISRRDLARHAHRDRIFMFWLNDS